MTLPEEPPLCSTCGKVANSFCSNSFHLPSEEPPAEVPSDVVAKARIAADWYCECGHQMSDHPNGCSKCDCQTFRVSADQPQWDSTDAAHPAWWRGNDRGVEATVEALNRVLDEGKAGTFASPALEKLAQRVASLSSQLEAKKDPSQ